MPVDPSAYVAPTARVHPDAVIGPRTRIGEFCVVDEDVVIGSDLELAHIVAVSLDGQPLSVSSKILVQAMTEEKGTNFSAESAGNGLSRITNIGQDPWLFRNIQGTVSFKRPDAARLKVTALDFNGYPAADAGNAAKFNLLPDKVYYLIQK